MKITAVCQTTAERTSSIVTAKPAVGRCHAEEVSMAAATHAGLKYVADTVYDA
jgi:hypothetical protein